VTKAAALTYGIGGTGGDFSHQRNISPCHESSNKKSHRERPQEVSLKINVDYD